MSNRRQLLADARARAALRSNPQRRALRDALQAALEAREAEKEAARTVAIGQRDALAAARPEMAGVFDAFDRRVAGNAAITQPLNISGPGENILAAAMAESAATRDRAADARARAMDDLAQQELESRRGEGFAIRAANDRYAADAGKVLSRLEDLAADEGDFATAEFQRLAEAADRNAAAEARSRRTSDDKYLTKYGVTREEFLSLPREQRLKLSRPKRDAQPRTGLGSLTGQQEAQVVSAIENAQAKIDVYRRARSKKTNRPLKVHEITALLLDDGFDRFAVDAAWDLVYTGRLAPARVKDLHRRGVHVPKPWRPGPVAGPPKPRTG